VPIHAADVRRRFKIAVERIGPAVVAAGHEALNIARFGDELHAAMAADIVKHPQHAVAVPGDEQRQPHELLGQDVAPRRERIGEGDCGPCASHDFIALVLKIRRARVRCVRQSPRPLDRQEDFLQAPQVDGILLVGHI
jgi:hypothetical protein